MTTPDPATTAAALAALLPLLQRLSLANKPDELALGHRSQLALRHGLEALQTPGCPGELTIRWTGKRLDFLEISTSM